MTNVNDAEITSIYTSQATSAGVEDDAPNAPGASGSAATTFDVTLEMVAGSALNTEAYTLTVSCADLTTWTNAPGLVPAFPGTTIGETPFWKSLGDYITYSNNEQVTIPAGAGNGQVYIYTASLITANGEVASIKHSPPFVLY